LPSESSSAILQAQVAAWPNTRQDLLDLFRQRDYEERQIPRGHQARLLMRLVRLYERRGLCGRDDNVALCDLCSNADLCWSGLPRSAYRRPTPKRKTEDGGIVLPWVGPDYQPGGVVVVGINPNIGPGDATWLDLEHGISWEHYIRRSFERDRLTEDGSRFGGDSTRAAGLVLDSVAGRPIRDRSARELIDVLMYTARLQTVKCVPKTQVSKPTREMAHRCPELLLRDELAILEPAGVITFGAIPREGIANLRGYETISTRARRLDLGRLVGGKRVTRVYHLDHPRYMSGFSTGFASLRRHLQRQQLPDSA
jgi:hypothetical protein